MTFPNVLNQDKLRSLAEAQLANISQLEAAAYDKDKVLCELQIHQIELELQNEELRRTQQELEQARDRYIDLYEFSPVAYLTLTEQGFIQESNLTGATLLGVERHKLLQRRFAGFIDATDADRWHLFLSQALKQLERQTLDLTLKPADNRPLYAQLDCLPVLSADNHLLLRVALTDITARKQAEIAMQQAQQLAEEATRIKSQFLANMSHEIRTPLSAILGFAQVLAQDHLTKKQHEKINYILTAGWDLSGLINGILDYSKIEAGKLTLEQRLFLLEEVFTHLSQLIEFRVKEKNVELLFSTAAQTPPLLMGDAQRLSQILLNLIDNALKFSQNGKVAVSVKPLEFPTAETVKLQFSVQDNGIGITPEQIPLLFQSFSQVDSSMTRKYGGTGLGLAISKELAELMGGTIWLKSEFGKGSTFYFTAIFALPEEFEFDPNNDESQTISGNLDGRKVLLVEDDVFNCLIVEELLNNLNIHVTIAKNGKQAVERVKNEAFDMVLMDMQMPEMDGLTATKLIRADERLQNLPIIALTANAMNDDKQKCLAAGMNDYLAKPIDSTKLAQMLHHWFAKTKIAADN